MPGSCPRPGGSAPKSSPQYYFNILGYCIKDIKISSSSAMEKGQAKVRIAETYVLQMKFPQTTILWCYYSINMLFCRVHICVVYLCMDRRMDWWVRWVNRWMQYLDIGRLTGIYIYTYRVANDSFHGGRWVLPQGKERIEGKTIQILSFGVMKANRLLIIHKTKVSKTQLIMEYITSHTSKTLSVWLKVKLSLLKMDQYCS